MHDARAEKAVRGARMAEIAAAELAAIVATPDIYLSQRRNCSTVMIAGSHGHDQLPCEAWDRREKQARIGVTEPQLTEIVVSCNQPPPQTKPRLLEVFCKLRQERLLIKLSLRPRKLTRCATSRNRPYS